MSAGFSFRRGDFPADFLFGAATSAYQIEGHGFGGAGPTHWDSFAATPGNVAGAQDGRIACDHYHRFGEDLDILQASGLTGYRFSTSWARVMPDGVTLNPEGLDFYDRLVDAICARGLEPWLTLYHWELPQALSDAGGWRNRDTTARFADFARVMAARIGDRIATVAPINEPWCVAWLSHFTGHHAPGLRDIRATARAMHHVALAHGRAIEALRAEGIGGLGGVCNLEYVHPADDTPQSSAAARRYDAIYNQWFLGGFLQGRYPEAVLEGLGPHMPLGWEADMATISAPLDWVGLNYYTCARIKAAPGPWPALAPVPGPGPHTRMGWEIHPEGLSALLRRVRDHYTGDLPLFVTENGMADDDVPDQPDGPRIAYLDAHLSAARDAMAAGVPLKGYFFWSLLDNFEWAFGYAPRFGLVHVDFDTLERRPKASLQALRAVLTSANDAP